jgi:hypothetical protein
LFDWVQKFAGEKAPKVLKDGGNDGLKALQAEATQLTKLVTEIPPEASKPPIFQRKRVAPAVIKIGDYMTQVRDTLKP